LVFEWLCQHKFGFSAHGIHQLIVIGPIAHTCIEATVRFAAELGYEVTVARDATTDYSDEKMHAVHRRQYPKLRQRHCWRGGGRGFDFCSPN
jgi:nicotinamidase-related amidase